MAGIASKAPVIRFRQARDLLAPGLRKDMLAPVRSTICCYLLVQYTLMCADEPQGQHNQSCGISMLQVVTLCRMVQRVCEADHNLISRYRGSAQRLANEPLLVLGETEDQFTGFSRVPCQNRSG